ncbi:MAG: hypothetical protein ACI9MR_002560 [Myxococcota bacterium]|jgi:uncharacterized protein YjbJ (UPF0337 family)
MLIRRLFPLLVLALFALGLSVSPALATPAEAPASYDDEAPDEDYVFEDGHALEDGTTVDGFYRVRTRPDYAWAAGSYTDGRWIAGHWRHTGAKRANSLWVPGHLGTDGYWVFGHWRKTARTGFAWVRGHRNPAGILVHGHWAPAAKKTGKVWVRGHRNVAGAWIPGHWRMTARAGFGWKAGSWRYGRFVRGHWAPNAKKAGNVWVGGYHGPKGWVKGAWRASVRPGHHWTAARWVAGVWTVGRWMNGKRPILKRRYKVRPVRSMRASRASNTRLWRNGERQRRAGKTQERRGKAVKAVGKATGNKRLEKKGKKMQKKGDRKQKRGKTKKRIAR